MNSMFQSVYLNGSSKDDQLETIDYYTYRTSQRNFSSTTMPIQFSTATATHGLRNQNERKFSNNPYHESNYPYFSSKLINGFYSQNSSFLQPHLLSQLQIKNDDGENGGHKSKKRSKETKLKAKKNKSRSPSKVNKDRKRSRSRHSSKKSFDSVTNLDTDSDSDAFESAGTSISSTKATPHSMSFTESAVKKIEESSLHSVFQSILLPGIMGKSSHKSTSDNTEGVNNHSNDSSKHSTIDNRSNAKTKATRSFSLKKLADKITSSAGVLKDRLVLAKNQKKKNSTFYPEVIVDDFDAKEKTEKNSDKEKENNVNTSPAVHLSRSSVSDEYNEDLNSTVSITNLVLSEKSSINLNESIPEEENVTENYYSKHDCETFWLENENGEENLDVEKVKKDAFNEVVELNEFWNTAEMPVAAKRNSTEPVYDVPLYQSYDDLACVEDNVSTKNETHGDLISSTLLITNLWSQLPDVKNSQLLEKMDKKEIELQERWFEIFHSELSYNKTLSLLNDIIISECKKELSEYNLNLIFTRHIDPIIQISNSLIAQLQQRIKSEICIRNLFDILYDTFNDPKFEVYVAFAGEQASQKENYDRLVKENKRLYEITQSFITNPRLQSKDILSFLIAPVQRVPRYKLLVEAVLKLLPSTEEATIQQGNKVLEVLEKILQGANEKAKQYSSIAEAIKLQMMLKYDNPNLVITNLVSTKRYLLYHSDLISLSPIIFDNTGQSKKTRKSEPSYAQNSPSQHVVHHLILFTDILILALKTYTDEKNFYYRVIKVYQKENVKADLAEWKIPSFMEQQCMNTDESNKSFNDEPCSSYLLSLTIKNDNPDKLAEFRKPLDIKICFICSRLEGEEWIKHIHSMPQLTKQNTTIDECDDAKEPDDIEYLKLDTQNKDANSNDFIQLVPAQEEKRFISVEHITLNTSAKSHAKLKKKIKSFNKQINK